MNADSWSMLAGGLGLFLLGMKLMSDGLRTAAGDSLRRTLQQATKTTLRGILAGASITAMVQSSSAVTVATIGFVNAGLLSLLQAVGVIYGSNIGTTMTGWLVSLIGLHISIKALAMPLIASGALINLIARRNSYRAIAQALAGFGLFFLGIDMLKVAFEGMGNQFDLASMASEGLISILRFVGIGVLLTFFMQSSSATIAITLTATAGGMIPLPAAAAMVIGANIGTTTTALLAVIGATTAARRVALAHVAFNIVTGIVALLLLPLLLFGLQGAEQWFGVQLNAAITLAAFHTLFNILGVVLMWPLTPLMVTWLERLFQYRQQGREDLPKYLDKNILATPSLAMDALQLELQRTRDMAMNNAAAAISAEAGTASNGLHKHQALRTLAIHIAGMIADIHSQELNESVARRLPMALESVRYHQLISDLAEALIDIKQQLQSIDHAELATAINNFRQQCAALVRQQGDAQTLHAQVGQLKRDYRQLKQQLLHHGIDGDIGIRQMVLWLDYLRMMFRMMQEVDRGNRSMQNFAAG